LKESHKRGIIKRNKRDEKKKRQLISGSVSNEEALEKSRADEGLNFLFE